MAAVARAADANEPAAKPQPDEQKPEYPQVPKRPLGKTGLDISVLSLGGETDYIENQIMLRKALDWGVTYWDTANNYAGGNSELGIGLFFERNPDLRKKITICSKATLFGQPHTPENIQGCLDLSLERMKTDYIDLYCVIHGLSDPAELTDEIRDWAKEKKQAGTLRHIGFSTHKNMIECLNAAAKLDWIDFVMTSYNFRLMQDAEFIKAVKACGEKGIGIIAMKTQGHKAGWDFLNAQEPLETEEDKKLVEHFLQRGFTEGQAKIKAVLENPAVASACVRVKSVALLTVNVAAVLDKTELSADDMAAFDRYAERTCDGYCAGCANICESAVAGMSCVSDVIRYLMYYHAYGERQRAKESFAALPAYVRNNLTGFDYAKAEKLCPHNIPIARLMTHAAAVLT